MAAATAATTHAPLMAAVMAFELSGDYAVVLPLMLATALATIALAPAAPRLDLHRGAARARRRLGAHDGGAAPRGLSGRAPDVM